MKALSAKTLVILVLIVLVAMTGFIQNKKKTNSQTNTFLAGAVKVNITPGTPIRMQGYGNRDKPFKAVHDSLYATATVIGDGVEKSAIITADLIGFSHDFCKATIERIADEVDIKKEFILMSANHNHGGPVNKTYETSVEPEIEKYVQSVQDKIIRAVIEADNKMQPAMIGIGKGTCNMNINRRARFADGNIGLGRNPNGPCDHDVAVIRIDDMERTPIAIHVNWPCHGTVSGQENYEITGDWPGSAARFVEKAFSGKVIVPVTAGASGDINPIYGPNKRFEDIEAIGMILGEEVVRIASAIHTQCNGTLNASKMTVMAKGKKRSESRAPDQKLEPAEAVPINLSVLKIGNIIFAGVSGELMTEIGMRIKSESPYKNTIVITHCDGSSGYLCTNQAYPEGGYEAQVSITMPGTEYLISESLNKMILECY